MAAVETPYAPTQEMRFAVVLYGGVSLAIYINGVVQELLHLVRATAPNATVARAGETGPSSSRIGDGAEATEKVYREARPARCRFGAPARPGDEPGADPDALRRRRPLRQLRGRHQRHLPREGARATELASTR